MVDQNEEVIQEPGPIFPCVLVSLQKYIKQTLSIPPSSADIRTAIDAKLVYIYHGGTGPSLRFRAIRE